MTNRATNIFASAEFTYCYDDIVSRLGPIENMNGTGKEGEECFSREKVDT